MAESTGLQYFLSQEFFTNTRCDSDQSFYLDLKQNESGSEVRKCVSDVTSVTLTLKFSTQDYIKRLAAVIIIPGVATKNNVYMGPSVTTPTSQIVEIIEKND